MAVDQLQYEQPVVAEPQRGSRAAATFGWIVFWLTVCAWLVVFAAAADIGTSLYAIYQGDRILAGVRALGLDLSGQTTAEAAQRLQAAWLSHTISISDGTTTWEFTPNELGMILDAETTARRAHAQWRFPADWTAARNTVAHLMAFLPSYVEPLRPLLERVVPAGPPIEPPLARRFDREIATATLRRLAAQIDLPERDASIAIVDGRVVTTPAETGRVLPIGEVLTQLERDTWRIYTERTLTLTPMIVRPAVETLGDLPRQAEALLDNKITIRLWDPITDERLTGTVPRQVIGDWLTLDQEGPDPQTWRWQIDEERIARWLEQQSVALGGTRRVDAAQAIAGLVEAITTGRSELALRVYHNERVHVVRPGETLSSIGEDYGIPYPWIQAANPDIGDTLRAGQAIVIPSPDELLPLPPVENKRIRISLSQQRMQAYENGALVWDWPISSGIASSPTSPGVFQIQSHEPNAYAPNWDLWMPNFMGIYRPAPNQAFMNGFHGFPKRGNGNQVLWTNSLGKPATFGCILLSTENSKLLYEWAEPGVIVVINR